MSLTLHAALSKIAEAELPDFLGCTVDSVHSRNAFGDTPLHVAAIWGDAEMAQVFLASGAEIDARGEHNCTPLHYAVEQEKIEVARLLIQHGADLKAKDKSGWDISDYCAASKLPEINALVPKENSFRFEVRQK
jgi:ankyrin repeat protein